METITWPITIKSIFQSKHWIVFQKRFKWLIRKNSLQNIDKILSCWTWELGFASFSCDGCWEILLVPFTCKSRFCNSCSQPQSDLWINHIVSWLPSLLRYRHVTFTIPKELRAFFKRHRSALSILPRTAFNALQYFVAKQNIKLGAIAVIHTFWARLNWNPHVHLVLCNSWVHESWTLKHNVFLPYKAIRTSWTKFLVKNLKDRVYSNLHGQRCTDEITFLNTFYNYQSKVTWEQTTWHVHFWENLCSFKLIIWYVWRYVKRPVISQTRLMYIDENDITYSYVDKRDDTIKYISCSILNFIWRLLQHLPNKNFRMIYYYWMFANRCKQKYLSIINSFYPHPDNLPTIPTKFWQRMCFFTWKNPLLCSCSGHFLLHSLVIPWYPPKYFDSW